MSDTRMARIIALALLLFGSSLESSAKGQKGNSLPPGDWSLTVGPAREPSTTVDVYSVLTDAKKGLATTEVGLYNKTNKSVAGVKIGWRLFDRNAAENTLLQGESPLIGVALSSYERRIVQYPVVTFARIHQPLIRSGKVTGNYRIELQVTEVLYDEEVGGRAEFTKVTSRRSTGAARMVKVVSRLAPPPQTKGCPDQNCTYNINTACYRCELAVGFACKWQSCSQCLEERCLPG